MPLVIRKKRKKTKADPLLEVAAKYEPSLARAAYSLLASLKNIKDPGSADLTAHLLATFSGAGLAPGVRSFRDAFLRAMDAGARFAIEGLASVRVNKLDVATAMSFALQNPEVVAFLTQYGFDLIRGITLETAAAIRLIMQRNVAAGIAPKETAREIMSVVGLTERQAQAVLNFRRALQSGDFAAAKRLALRDKRFDGSLKQGAKLTPEQIDRIVQRYAERQLRYRAQMIARTESIRALNKGQIEAWRQADEQGLLEADMREQWLPGPEACPLCDSIPSMNPEGVRIGGLFNTPYGFMDGPPAHPNCRCALGLE